MLDCLFGVRSSDVECELAWSLLTLLASDGGQMLRWVLFVLVFVSLSVHICCNGVCQFVCPHLSVVFVSLFVHICLCLSACLSGWLSVSLAGCLYVCTCMYVNRSLEIYRRYLQRACVALARQKKLNSTLIQALASHAHNVKSHAAVPTDYSFPSNISSQYLFPCFLQGAWLILSCVSPYCSDINAQFVLGSYHDIKNQQSESILECQILSIMGNIANQLSIEQIQTLEADLSQRLLQMEADPQLVAAIITCLMKFNEVVSSESSHQRVAHWARPVLESCHEYIQRVVMGEVLSNDDDTALVRYLYTIGELAQQCPELLNDDTSVMVQSLIIGQVDDSMATRVGLSGKSRAHAFVTLGKLCLQKKELAKQSVVLLARELEESDDPVIRNNVIVVMSDLCVR